MINVYIPTNGNLEHIARGSGIVGSFDEGAERIRIDYEGNLYGSENLRTYAERVMHAWDRHVTHYPTIAREWVLFGEIVDVGTYDSMSQMVLIHPEMEPQVRAWLGLSEEDDIGKELMVS